jgi:hypothetical protein
MKRIGILFVLFALVILSLTVVAPISEAQRTKKKSTGKKTAIPCPSTLGDINDCPDTGCGPSLDPNLNKQKNIRALDGEAEPMTIQQMRNLPDPVPGFKIGDPREKLAALGEGKKIVVVANALVVRKGGGESCNCKLTSVADTDNHIVLVDRVLRIKSDETPKETLARREENSITAEFAPRPRLESSNLTRANLLPLIQVDGVQKVRVTGILMFDSEHSLGGHLKRHNNWEIHPVLAMDYCPRKKKCTADSDANWVKLGEQP